MYFITSKLYVNNLKYHCCIYPTMVLWKLQGHIFFSTRRDVIWWWNHRPVAVNEVIHNKLNFWSRDREYNLKKKRGSTAHWTLKKSGREGLKQYKGEWIIVSLFDICIWRKYNALDKYCLRLYKVFQSRDKCCHGK